MDDVSLAKTVLAASAETSAKVIAITQTGGVDEVQGVWSDDKQAMERLLGGAIVLFKGSDPDDPVFGSIPHVGAFQTSSGVSRVKISKEGTAHGQWFDSAKLKSDTSAIWVGAVSGLPSSVTYKVGSLVADIQLVPVTDGGIKQLRVTIAGKADIFEVAKAAAAVGFPVSTWPSFASTPRVEPTYGGPATMVSVDEAMRAELDFEACCINSKVPTDKIPVARALLGSFGFGAFSALAQGQQPCKTVDCWTELVWSLCSGLKDRASYVAVGIALAELNRAADAATVYPTAAGASDEAADAAGSDATLARAAAARSGAAVFRALINTLQPVTPASVGDMVQAASTLAGNNMLHPGSAAALWLGEMDKAAARSTATVGAAASAGGAMMPPPPPGIPPPGMPARATPALVVGLGGAAPAPAAPARASTGPAAMALAAATGGASSLLASASISWAAWIRLVPGDM